MCNYKTKGPQPALSVHDFSVATRLPLFTDMCKFEMACLFEYVSRRRLGNWAPARTLRCGERRER